MKGAEREIDLDTNDMLGIEAIADGPDTSRPVAFGAVKEGGGGFGDVGNFGDSDGDGLPDVFDPAPDDPNDPVDSDSDNDDADA